MSRRAQRIALVAIDADRRLDRDPPEERRTDVVGELLAAALTEQRVARTIGRHELTHVLDDADDSQIVLRSHVGGGRAFWALSAGVVTISISARGSILARPICTSPVPGGMSIRR